MSIGAGFAAVFFMFLSMVLLYITSHDVAGTLMALFSGLASMMMGIAMARGA